MLECVFFGKGISNIFLCVFKTLRSVWKQKTRGHKNLFSYLTSVRRSCPSKYSKKNLNTNVKLFGVVIGCSGVLQILSATHPS